MTNLIVALLTLGAILTGVVVLSQSAFSPQADIAGSIREIQEKSDEMARTEISAVSVNVTGSGSDVELTVRNDGQTPLRLADDWDFFMSYDPSSTSTGLRIVRLGYTDSGSLTDDQWELEGIYRDVDESEVEIYGKGVVDAGEEAVISAKLATPIASSSSNSLALTSNNGVTVSTQFSY